MVSYSWPPCTVLTHRLGLNPCCSGQWSRTDVNGTITIKLGTVLILVVVDNGLVPSRCLEHPARHVVLILVVVDNGLVHNNVEVNDFDTKVLILVVVDNGLVLDLIRHY